MSGPADLYQVLGVTPDAEACTIRSAYRTLAWQHHPDVGGSQQAMAALNEAWQVLRDPNARAKYDSRRSALDSRVPGSGRDGAIRRDPPPQPQPRAESRSASRPSVEDRPPAAPTSAPPAGSGAAARGAVNRAAGPGRGDGSTVLDFGRYEGWSLGQLSTADPDYLEWLARTSIGRRLQPEIAALLASRRAGATARQSPSRQPRRASRWSRARASNDR